MNNFSSFSSQLFRGGGIDKNSLAYVNKSSAQLDLSGSSDSLDVSHVYLTDTTAYDPNAYSVNFTTSAANDYLLVNVGNAPLDVSDVYPQEAADYTLYTKYKYHSHNNHHVFGQHFETPRYYLELSGTTLTALSGLGDFHVIDPFYIQ